MKLEEEVDHYLAGLREANPTAYDAAIAPELNQEIGHGEAVVPPMSEGDEPPQSLGRQCVAAGPTQQVVTCDDFEYLGRETGTLSQQVTTLQESPHSQASSGKATAPSIWKSQMDRDKSNTYADIGAQDRAFFAKTRHVTFSETIAPPDHNNTRGTNEGTDPKFSNTGDGALDAEKDIFQHYASAKSSEASLSTHFILAIETDEVLANEEEYEVLQSSSKVEEDDWDDCKVSEP